MRTASFFGLMLSAIVLIAVSGCGQDEVVAPAPSTPSPAAAVVPRTANAFIYPSPRAELSFITGGRVERVLVREGQEVTAGSPLVHLESAVERASLSEAEAGFARAEAALEALLRGPRAGEIAAAEAEVAAAQAHLDAIVRGALPEEIAAAEAELAAATAQLEHLRNSPRAEQIAAASKAVDVAEAELVRAKAGATAEQLAAAEEQVKIAEANLQQAQAAYDKVAWMPDIAARPEAAQLQQATAHYEAAKATYEDLLDGPTPEEVAVYEARVAQAQAQLEEVRAGPSAQELAAAEAAVTQAQARLDLLENGPSPEDERAARARLEQAQAALDLLREGATAEELSAARAEVDAAAAAVEGARALVDRLSLVAPFDGVVGRVSVEVGEVVQPSAPAISLAGKDGWVVETDDLTEMDVFSLRPGDVVSVVVDALGGQVLTGKVESVEPRSSMKRGDVTYTVRAVLNPLPEGVELRWGLSAVVNW